MKKFEEDILLLEDQNSKFLKVSREGSEGLHSSRWVQTCEEMKDLAACKELFFLLHSKMDKRFRF